MLVYASIFIGLSVVVAIFQLLLALGAPFGEFTMGGKYPGRLPVKMRIAAIIQIAILFLFTATIMSKAGIAFNFLHDIARYGVWVVFAFFIIGSVVNLTSSSKKEKFVMGPLNLVALFCSFMVAIN